MTELARANSHLAVSQSVFKGLVGRMVNNEFENKQLGSNLKYYPSICLIELRKIAKYPIQESRSPGRYLNPGPYEYET
jgi:hypothetical protein